MTLKQLKEKVRVKRENGYCSYEVTITYRGKEYKCKSNNSLAWDAIDQCCWPEQQLDGYYTNKQAYEAFYDECKRANQLAEYNY